MRRAVGFGVGMFLIVGMLAPAVRGQGFLIEEKASVPTPLPRPVVAPQGKQPTRSYRIKELAIDADVKDQIATVQVGQTFVNTGTAQMQVSFVFPLPYDGAVTSMTLMVDGKEYPAKLLSAQEARKIYEGYVRKNQDPALLEWIGHGMFKTSVFPVPAGKERKVTVRYQQLLRKQHALTEFLFPLATAKYTSQPIDTVRLSVSIAGKSEIKNVYSPSHDVKVERPDAKHAVVTYKASKNVPVTNFRLFYDTGASVVGTSLLSYRPMGEDGYFVLLATPEIPSAAKKPSAKNVIFVIDRSGSMSGKKIEQAREALKFVLNNLRDGDLFNIVAYDKAVESFRPELQRYNEDSRKAALGFVSTIKAGGSTNISGALSTAMGMLKDDSRPSYVIFLTDGRPTAGEQNEVKIVDIAKSANDVRARLIAFGVGYDVNSRLIDRLCRANFGQSEYVSPDQDIEAHVSRLYDKMSSPVMSDVQVSFELKGAGPEDGPAVTRLMPKRAYDLFAGQQLVMAGRYARGGDVTVTITGKVGGKEQKLTFEDQFVKQSDSDSLAFIEKLWATRRVGEIIDELDLKGKNEELVKELVHLSTKHGILTPYTAYLADDRAKAKDLAAWKKNYYWADKKLSNLSQSGGQAGFNQRLAKGSFRQAAKAPSSKFAEGKGQGQSYRRFDGQMVTTTAVCNVGKHTLYRRGKSWIASNAVGVDLEKDQDKIKEVKRFSDEYFQIVAKNSPEENAILAHQSGDSEVIVKLRGQLYRVK